MEARNMTPIQVRSETNGIHYLASLAKAFQYANIDDSVWKISWTDEEGHRIRLVRKFIHNLADVEEPPETLWKYEPMEDEIKAALEEEKGDAS